MYAETGLMFPYLQNFTQEVHLFNEFGFSQKPNASSLGLPTSFLQTSATIISDYNLGGDGDLFKAPEPVIGEPSVGLDPMTAAITMISSGEDVICPQSLTVSDVESSIENGQLLSEVFYECRKDLLAKEGTETPLSEVLSIKIPTDETYLDEKSVSFQKSISSNSILEGPFQKSVSSGCLKSMDSMVETPLNPSFLDFPVLDFGAVYGMRRAFSEGDIKVSFLCLILHFTSVMEAQGIGSKVK
ncbi:uncharacterized protein LOC127245149 isoform X2 [Andrographis paniculata]|uniref:uncharacterized protein LOC127245149 isoform X2 n=1 Tax=Andrographis paniculata TaxID=175694 RepID=UPI0021E81951|nr:uncharacterized protein LOC127245149 isoform X2 [Andrographis paniculata]